MHGVGAVGKAPVTPGREQYVRSLIPKENAESDNDVLSLYNKSSSKKGLQKSQM